MAFKEGSVVQVSFTGKDKDTGEVFDTTEEKEAIAAGIFQKGKPYGGLTLVVGEGEILPGLEEEIKKMGEGESKQLVLSPAQGFGERKAELIRMVPLQEFRNRNLQPFPGMQVDLNGMPGKVTTLSGGRVRVDFNPALAGKSLEFQVSVKKELKTAEEKTGGFFARYFGSQEGGKAEVRGNQVHVTLPRLARSQGKLAFAGKIYQHLPETESISFEEKLDRKRWDELNAEKNARQSP